MANLWPPSLMRATDDNGNPSPGAKMEFFTTGTTTHATFYLDAAEATAGANPLEADGAGMFPPVFLHTGTIYRIKQTNAAGSETFFEVDPVDGSSGGGSGGYTDENARDAIGAALREGAGINITVDDPGDTITIGLDNTDPDSIKPTESFIAACSDETTALTTGTGKVTFRIPYAFTLTSILGSLTTAQASGSILVVDVNKNGSSILSTKLTIDNTEKSSKTAATPLVMSSTSLSDDDEISVDIDQVGDGTATGLKVTLIGHRS